MRSRVAARRSQVAASWELPLQAGMKRLLKNFAFTLGAVLTIALIVVALIGIMPVATTSRAT